MDVIALGELLIDFVSTETGVSVADAPAFEKAPGGAPANVAVGLAKLGTDAAFMGKIGDDEFGHFLANVLRDHGVNTDPLRYTDEANTMLAFVAVDTDGERTFTFYRNPSADMLFEPDEVDADAIRRARILHIGSITLISEPAGEATRHAAQVAGEAGTLLSYDPNLRLPLWPDEGTARAGILSMWPQADLVKVSDEELLFLTGVADEAAAVESLWHDRLKLLVVTKGRKGSTYYTSAFHGDVPSFEVDTVDTTGAGDGFVAGLLHRLLANDLPFGSEADIRDAVRYGNAVGASTTIRRGAIPALPTPDQVSTLFDR
ncbi:MAG: fructokinase [Chloroflexi bacterium]|nr:fructokinase [Chloroflexota bacterium]